MTPWSKLWWLLSQVINALFFKGDPDETLSARAHREGWGERIDKWLGSEHCRRVYDKHKTLQQRRAQ